MKWLLLAAALVGCSLNDVSLLTGVDASACYAGGEQHFHAQLVAGGAYGTMIDGKPVMWPVGYKGRHAGSTVEVVGPAGTVVATTGKWYSFGPGVISDLDAQATQARLNAVAVAACGTKEIAPGQ